MTGTASRRVTGLCLLALAVAACSTDRRPAAAPAAPSRVSSAASSAAPASAVLYRTVCEGSAVVTDAGTISAPGLTEASGLVASRLRPGVWWTHNDGGSPARLLAADSTGRTLADVAVTGGDNRDWEDIAGGPGGRPGDPPLLYVGDIGNNQAIDDPAGAPDTVRIYRLPEPSLSATSSAPVATLTFRYPDGAHDAEAMFVDPIDGDLVIVTKAWGRGTATGVYRATGVATLADGSSTTLESVGTVPLPAGTLVTAADVTRDGRLIALRSYGAVDLYQRAAGKPFVVRLCLHAVLRSAAGRGAGESVAFSADGGSYVTTSEGAAPVLHRTGPR